MRPSRETKAAVSAANLSIAPFSDLIILAGVGTTYSRVGTEPVSLDLVGLEHLFSELLVSTVLDGVDLESV